MHCYLRLPSFLTLALFLFWGFLCTKNDLPLTVRFPFSETSKLLVASMSRTSNWTEPELESLGGKREGEAKSDEHLNWKSGHHISLLYSHPCSPALTSLGQDGCPMDGNIFKVYRGDFQVNPQTSRQGTPYQHQVTRCWVEDTPINAVSAQVVVRRLWAHVCH